MSKSSNTLLGILTGTAIGATLGILFAPDKGLNTRNRSTEEALLTKDKLAKQAAELKDSVSSTLASKKVTLDERVNSLVTDASYKADDVISTLERRLKDLKAKNKKYQNKNETIVNGNDSTTTV